jgi:hypothetical protein
MDQTIGNQSLPQQESSPLSDSDLGLITTALLTYGVEPSKVEAMAQAVKAGAQKSQAEMEVPGWQADPPLLSDKDFTFAEETDQAKTVRLKILGLEYYWSDLLPRIEEWTTALYQGQTLSALMASQPDPVGFILDVCQQILRRPKNDRLKISFYQFFAFTFSTQEVELRPQWVAVLPPDELMAAIRKLVDTNRRNFTRLWAEMPTPLKYQLSLLNLTCIEALAIVRGSLSQRMLSIARGIQSDLDSNGGQESTGTDGSGALLADLLPQSLIS